MKRDTRKLKKEKLTVGETQHLKEKKRERDIYEKTKDERKGKREIK